MILIKLDYDLNSEWKANYFTLYNFHLGYVSSLFAFWRCATGEAWPSIMLSCTEGKECQQVPNAESGDSGVPVTTCGSNIAFPYFVSFIFFCSFLVSLLVWTDFMIFWISHYVGTYSISDAEFVRGCHHG